MRTAIDWETVTPLDEIPRSSLSNRRQARAEMVETQASGGLGMNAASATPLEHRRLRPPSWLAARSRGRCPPGAVVPARAVVRLPGAGRGREPTGPDRPAPRRAGRSGPAVLAVDRPARDGPAAPSLRDVARGARAGAGGAGSAAFRSCSRRSAGTSRARWPRSSAVPSERLAGLAAWGLRSIAPGDPELAARAAAAGRSSSCPTRAPRRTSSCGSSGSRASGSASCPTACLPSFGRPRRSCFASDGERIRSSSPSGGSSRGRTRWA